MQVQTNRAGAITFLILLQVVISFVGTAGFLLWSGSDKLAAGITIAGMEVGQLTEQQAISTIATYANQCLTDAKLELVASDGKRWVIDLRDLQAFVDAEATIEAAWQIGRQKTWWQNMLARVELLFRPIDIPLKIGYDPAQLWQSLAQAKQYFYRPPINARATLINDKIEITDEKVGSELDLDATINIIQSRLALGDLSPVPVVEREIAPVITKAELAGITDLLGICVTRLDLNERERTENIKLAAKAVDGTVLGPGQLFSFNKQLGPRFPERGYKKAPMFWHDQVILAEGGGVCQVATTLYNAVLQANLEVQQRFPHTQPVNYVPPGQDATIAGEEVDLKFSNTTDGPIFISATVDNDKLIVRIFGVNKNKEQHVKILTEKQTIEPKVVVETDPSLTPGSMWIKTEGKPGYEVKVYRVVEQSGQELSRQLISTDLYPAKPTVVVVGPKPPNFNK
ncbi:MAG: hypothetical protein HPY81_06865 [Firmicutes bacterium]|nr:hypothetical protein [Bacillota bacterium]